MLIILPLFDNEIIEEISFHQTKNVRRGREYCQILKKSQQRSHIEKQ